MLEGYGVELEYLRAKLATAGVRLTPEDVECLRASAIEARDIEMLVSVTRSIDAGLEDAVFPAADLATDCDAAAAQFRSVAWSPRALGHHLRGLTPTLDGDLARCLVAVEPELVLVALGHYIAVGGQVAW